MKSSASSGKKIATAVNAADARYASDKPKAKLKRAKAVNAADTRYASDKPKAKSKRAKECEIPKAFDEVHFNAMVQSSQYADLRVKPFVTKYEEEKRLMALSLKMPNVQRHILEEFGERFKEELSNKVCWPEADHWKQKDRADCHSWQFLLAGNPCNNSFSRRDFPQISRFVRALTSMADKLSQAAFELLNLGKHFKKDKKVWNGFINVGAHDDPGMDEHLDNQLTNGKELEFFTIMIPIFCSPGYGKFIMRESIGSKHEEPLVYDMSCAYALNNRTAHYVQASNCIEVSGQTGYRLVSVFHYLILKRPIPPAHAPPPSIQSNNIKSVSAKAARSAKGQVLLLPGGNSRKSKGHRPKKIDLPRRAPMVATAKKTNKKRRKVATTPAAPPRAPTTHSDSFSPVPVPHLLHAVATVSTDTQGKARSLTVPVAWEGAPRYASSSRASRLAPVREIIDLTLDSDSESEPQPTPSPRPVPEYIHIGLTDDDSDDGVEIIFPPMAATKIAKIATRRAPAPALARITAVVATTRITGAPLPPPPPPSLSLDTSTVAAVARRTCVHVGKRSRPTPLEIIPSICTTSNDEPSVIERSKASRVKRPRLSAVGDRVFTKPLIIIPIPPQTITAATETDDVPTRQKRVVRPSMRVLAMREVSSRMAAKKSQRN